MSQAPVEGLGIFMTRSAPSGTISPPSTVLSPVSAAVGPLAPIGPATRASSHQSLHGIFVSDVMVRDVVTVAPGETLRVAMVLLGRKRISGLPVVAGDGRVVGVLSEKDILRVLKQQGGLGLPGGLFDLLLEPSEARQRDMLAQCRRVLDETKVADVMTSPAQTIQPTNLTVEAIRRMLDSRINRLPVVEAGRLVGIVTRRDVLSAHLEPS
jgi:CBS domain-containing protein